MDFFVSPSAATSSPGTARRYGRLGHSETSIGGGWIVANMQPGNAPIHLVLRHAPYSIAKRHFLRCETACFGSQNGLFRRAKQAVL